jgi:phage terminase large subunit
MEHFARAGIVLQPRQLLASAAARECDRAEGPVAVGYGGARGGGKSHWLLAQMGADDCQRVPGLKCLLLRKVGKANIEHFDDLRRRLFPSLANTFTGYKGLLTFANGSRIVAGHFQYEKDVDAYLGLEYDVIGIEEATTLAHRKYQDITTCCRSSTVMPGGAPWRPRIYSTTNPGGVGHSWYRDQYVVPYRNGKETGTRFIPARVGDNRFNNPEYRSVLAALSGWQRRAWLDGDWDLAAGQFFTTFRRDQHVLKEFDNAKGVRWFAALDYGFTHYTVVLLACEDADGNIIVVDEHAERLWLPSRHAAAVKAMLARHGLTMGSLRRFTAGADIFGRESSGRSVALQYGALGIRLTAARMDRVGGWAEVLEKLGDPDGGVKPTLFIHERCSRLLSCLPSLQHDPNRPEDVLKVDADEAGIGGDDAADALRYLMSAQRVQCGAAVVR